MPRTPFLRLRRSYSRHQRSLPGRCHSLQLTDTQAGLLLPAHPGAALRPSTRGRSRRRRWQRLHRSMAQNARPQAVLVLTVGRSQLSLGTRTRDVRSFQRPSSMQQGAMAGCLCLSLLALRWPLPCAPGHLGSSETPVRPRPQVQLPPLDARPQPPKGNPTPISTWAGECEGWKPSSLASPGMVHPYSWRD